MLIMCVLFMKHSSLSNKTFGFVHRRQEQNVMPMTKWVYNHNHTTATATLMPTTMLAERNETYALYIIYTCIFRIEFPSPFHICFMLLFYPRIVHSRHFKNKIYKHAKYISMSIFHPFSLLHFHSYLHACCFGCGVMPIRRMESHCLVTLAMSLVDTM